MTSQLRITIVTAVYNNANTILKCLHSVGKQKYKNIEHIVVDGGSTDGTLEKLRAHLHNIDILVSEPDEGVCDAWNKGIALATGDIIGFLHSDDIFFDAFVLQEVANACKSGADVVWGDLDYVNNLTEKKVIRHWVSSSFAPKKLRFGWMPPHPSVFIKREIYQEIGCFDMSLKISGDYQYLLRVFLHPNVVTAYVPKTFVSMSVGGLSNKKSNLFRKSIEDRKVIMQQLDKGYLVATLIVFVKVISKISQFFISK